MENVYKTAVILKPIGKAQKCIALITKLEIRWVIAVKEKNGKIKDRKRGFCDS